MAIDISAIPLLTDADVPLIVTPVSVPVFLVNPQPETVDSVTSLGMAIVTEAIPLLTDADVPLTVTPVSVPVLDVLEFQLVMSAADMEAAADAEKTGSDSDVRNPVMVCVCVPVLVTCPAAS